MINYMKKNEVLQNNLYDTNIELSNLKKELHKTIVERENYPVRKEVYSKNINENTEKSVFFIYLLIL